MSSYRDEFGDLRTGIENLFSETLGVIEESLFDLGSRSLRPLFSLNVREDTVTATFDLPGVRREGLAITCTEDTISVEAEMAKPVMLRVRSGHHQQKEFVRYSRKVLLPVKVIPEKGEAKFRNGIAVVKLPRRREGRLVPITSERGPSRARKKSARRAPQGSAASAGTAG